MKHDSDYHNLLPTAILKGDSEQTESLHSKTENVATGTVEEPDKSSKANVEIRKTWGFRRSTVAKREMPVEAATDCPESRYPVRRSGRQCKRTDKLEEFLLTTKRGLRKSAPPSLESGDPPSQTPTDAETASETSCDGNPDTKAGEDKAESPERRTRSSARMQTQRKTQGGRQTKGGGRVTVKDEGSSENEEDCRDGASMTDSQEKNDEKSPGDERCTKTLQLQPELVSDKTGAGEQKNSHEDKINEVESEKGTDQESDEDSTDRTAVKMVKRGPIRTYVNKKRAVNKSTTPVKAPVNKSNTPVRMEPKSSQAAAKTRNRRAQEDEDYEEEDDESDSTSSSSSSSDESDDGGYDPNALYCICRQKHNKRYLVFLNFTFMCLHDLNHCYF